MTSAPFTNPFTKCLLAGAKEARQDILRASDVPLAW